MSFKQRIKQNLINIPGWRTRRKIVVFESDDWGMIRMASNKAYERLRKKGYPLDQCAYNRNDALESNDDLRGLMEVLHRVKDKNGRPAKFTINNIVANPDFQRIRESKFQRYFYEPFTTTLRSYPHTNQVMELYREGMEAGVFQTQFHGREHVHVNNWLKALKRNEALFLDAFEENMFTLSKGINSSCTKECLDAMGAYNEDDKHIVVQSLREGASLFHSIWGFYSKSIIAPCYTWDSKLERYFNENRFEFIQGSRAQRQPIHPEKKKEIKRHYMGSKSKNGLLYLIRNVSFEPSTNVNKDWVDSALKEIKMAFRWQKPAIVSTHRVNYIGRINSKNRDQNLRLLKNLLTALVREWPEIEFISTDHLGSLMKNSEN